MTDFFSGWSFPRHLYSRQAYKVWGNLPYELPDYQTDAMLDILYPGYQDAWELFFLSRFLHFSQGLYTFFIRHRLFSNCISLFFVV